MIRALVALVFACTLFGAEEIIKLSDGREFRGEVAPDGAITAVYGTVRAPINLKGASVSSRRPAGEPAARSESPAQLLRESQREALEEEAAWNKEKASRIAVLREAFLKMSRDRAVPTLFRATPIGTSSYANYHPINRDGSPRSGPDLFLDAIAYDIMLGGWLAKRDEMEKDPTVELPRFDQKWRVFYALLTEREFPLDWRE